jgi:hypothetical protein
MQQPTEFLPQNRQRFPVAEAARHVARLLSISEQTARRRLYRHIDNGKLPVVQVLGVIYIERQPLEKAISGESIWDF